MRKTIFKGTINGEQFDNVADYNAKMNELLTANVKNINASSSTVIEEVEEPTHTKYVSNHTHDLYPFMNDPYNTKFYLDSLIVNDKEENKNKLRHAQDSLHASFVDIKSYLEDNDVSIEDKKRYLNDITSIINNIVDDRENTENATKTVNTKIDELYVAFDKIKKEYIDKLQLLEDELFMLNESKPVIDAFLKFYRDVESETIVAIKEQDTPKLTKNTNEHGCNGCCDNCDCHNNVKISEKIPQQEITNIDSLFQYIFGPIK